jgi:hypothetical protein
MRRRGGIIFRVVLILAASAVAFLWWRSFKLTTGKPLAARHAAARTPAVAAAPIPPPVQPNPDLPVTNADLPVTARGTAHRGAGVPSAAGSCVRLQRSPRD